MKKTIETDFLFSGIHFSYITPDDLDSITTMLAKDTVCEYVFFGPNTKEDTLAYFQPAIEETNKALLANRLPEQHVFVMKKNGILIGNCGIAPIAFAKGNYLIGYTIDEPFWRKGFGNIACRFLIDFGFNTLHAHRLSGDCMGDNIGSRKIMEGNGFTLEGCQPNYWYKNGKYHDNLLFGLLHTQPPV